MSPRKQPLSVTPLDESTVMRLVERGLRKGDELECYVSDSTPMKSLMEALAGDGPKYAAWALIDGYPTPVGAFGINTTEAIIPAIWSLWTDDLDAAMKVCIFRNTRKWVGRLLVEASVHTAANYVSCTNTLAIRWLKMSGCFRIRNRTETIGKARHEMQYFETRTLRELLNV